MARTFDCDSDSGQQSAPVDTFVLLGLWGCDMPDSDTLIREQCEPHLQRLAELVCGKFEATTGGGDAGLLAYVADRLEAAQELLDDVRCSGVEYTNPGRYHSVQICVATWQQIDDFVACE